MSSVVILLSVFVLWIGFGGSFNEDRVANNIQQISSDAVEFSPPTTRSPYVRQQVLLGPALNVTVREGDKALMPCIAPHLGDKTVSWIRQKDLAILISGGHVYTSDPRMESIHPSASDLWGLQISPVRTSDEGLYDCQVNTEPKQSRMIVLIVLEQGMKDSPSVPVGSPNSSTNKVSETISLNIFGSESRSVVEGNRVVFTCSATLSENGLYGKDIEVTWWHGDSKLISKASSARIHSHRSVGATDATTELTIEFVQLSDSGVYTCKAEPTYSLHQTIKTILKESSVTLNVQRRVTEENCGFSLLPLLSFSLIVPCCIAMLM